MPASSLPRNCAESCLDFFLLELVHKYTSEVSHAKAVATLEAIGNRVGKQLVERCARGRPRMADDLDVIKFLCKEFWTHVFQKQVDNLKTNHRVPHSYLKAHERRLEQGVYVLHDNHFRWMAHMNVSSAAECETPARKRLLEQYLALPCGLIAGALRHLGVNCTVEGDAKGIPLCTFTIKISWLGERN